MTIQTATFAAGCFWGIETAFRNITGVQDAICGYTGGKTDNPEYRLICAGNTGHAEAVQVTFDDETVTYSDLLHAFWGMHDPTQKDRQGPDVGSQYRSAIFVHDEDQRAKATASKNALNGSGLHAYPVVTEISDAVTFWKAEDYHQRYDEKNKRKFGGLFG